MTLLEAFEQTKKKWEWIIEHNPDDWAASPEWCGFCVYSKKLGTNPLLSYCEACPIAKTTGGKDCSDTPFYMDENLENALLEYDFLHYVALSEGIIE